MGKRNKEAAPLQVASFVGLAQDLRRKQDEATNAGCGLGKEEGRRNQDMGVQGNVQRLFEPKGCCAMVMQMLPIVIPHSLWDYVERKTSCKPTTSFVHSALPNGR